MTRNEFDQLVKYIGEEINAPCPENFKVIIWGLYKDWSVDEFKLHIMKGILEILNKNKGFNKHVNS